MTLEEILKLPIRRHDINAAVPLGEFFYELFIKLWIENEAFSAKRPWGNSGWDYDVYATLIKHGVITGQLDEDGYVDKLDEEYAKAFVKFNILDPILSKMVYNL